MGFKLHVPFVTFLISCVKSHHLVEYRKTRKAASQLTFVYRNLFQHITSVLEGNYRDTWLIRATRPYEY